MTAPKSPADHFARMVGSRAFGRYIVGDLESVTFSDAAMFWGLRDSWGGDMVRGRLNGVGRLVRHDPDLLACHTRLIALFAEWLECLGVKPR